MPESPSHAGGESPSHVQRHLDAAKKKRPKYEKYIAKTILSDPPRRLRRNMHGSTNLNATVTTYAEDYQSPKGDGYVDPTKIKKNRKPGEFRYVIDKIMDASQDGLTIFPDGNARHVPKLSVWSDRNEAGEDFRSTHTVDFDPTKLGQGSPREALKRRDMLRTAPHAPPERLQQREMAVARFRELVAAQYGNTAKMFKAVKKTKEDMLDPEEFENLMLRLNLGTVFPPAQQQLLLEALPAVYGSGVAVQDLISKVDTAAMANNHSTGGGRKTSTLASPTGTGGGSGPGLGSPGSGSRAGEHADILSPSMVDTHAFALPALSPSPVRAPAPATNSTATDAVAAAAASSSSRKAKVADVKMFGDDAAPLDLGTLSLDQYPKATVKASTAALAEFLQHTDIKLETVPFYDKRAESLNWRRFRANILDSELSDPAIQRQVALWEENKKKGKEIDRARDASREARMEVKRHGAKDDFVHPLGPKPKTLRDGGGNDVSTDLTDPANDRRNGAPADVALVSVAIKGRARNAALDLADKAAAKAAARKERSLTGEAEGPSPAEGTTIGSTEDSYLAAGLGKTNYMYDATEAQQMDFYPMMPKLFSTKTKLADPSMILMMEPSFSEPRVGATQKRMAPRDKLDFSRVGVGSNSTLYESKDGSFDSPQPLPGQKTVWQQSATADYFPPLIYQPSQPIMRHLESDADRELAKKVATRQARYEKGVKNVEGTLKRLADFEFDKHCKELFNVKARNEDRIRYEAMVFGHDLRRFRTQPLQTMSLKTNEHKAGQMWGGAEGAVNAPRQSPDDRNFLSTHLESYFDNTSMRNSTGKLLFTGH